MTLCGFSGTKCWVQHCFGCSLVSLGQFYCFTLRTYIFFSTNLWFRWSWKKLQLGEFLLSWTFWRRSLETWSWKETLSLQHWCYLVLWIDHKSTWLILLIGFIIWSRLVLAFLDWLIGVNLCLSQRHGYKADWLIPMTTFIAVLY